ncbi:LWR-salt protein [Halobacterium yunchengense]|uniref:LWR-salt protein n=1 Tax=Halobacterium yunchengense TaxID=3108497 RepID=UPI00300A526C
MAAAYAFAVRFRLDPDPGVRVDPQSFETRLYRDADDPGDQGWLFFRDNLWRGDLGDPAHFRALTEDALGVPVEAVEYRAFETDAASLDALKAAIGANLDLFNADSTTEVLHKYFGSSIEVRD